MRPPRAASPQELDVNRNIYHVLELGIDVPFCEAWFWALIEYTVLNTQTCQHLIP